MWCGTHTELGVLGWTLMSAGMIAFWGLLVWATIAVTRRARRDRQISTLEPRDILANTLARGEISTDEYTRAQQLLDESVQRNADQSKEVV
jgi:putative membrane protein